MRLQSLSVEGVIEVIPGRYGDDRGYFTETFRDDFFREQVSPVSFVQENQSLSRSIGTIRGLHFQRDPAAQGKLVRCVAGRIFDVAVDIRYGSRTFGQWEFKILTAKAGNQLWIPAGFLHGFCTLEPDTIVCYKVTSYYDRSADMGVAWNDPDIGVVWPDVADPSLLSLKDQLQPRLKDLPVQFSYNQCGV